MTLTIGEFAILAPVPIHHLTSALEVLSMKDYVAFGSMKFEVFHEVESVLPGDRNPNSLPGRQVIWTQLLAKERSATWS